MPAEKTFRESLVFFAVARHLDGPGVHWVISEAARLHEAEVAGLRARVDEVERQRDDAYLQAAQDVDELNHQLCQAEKRVEAVREYVNNSFEYGSSAMVEALSDFEGEKGGEG